MSDLKIIRKNIKNLEKDNRKEEAEKDLLKTGKPAITYLIESLITKDRGNEAKLNLLEKLILNHGDETALLKFSEHAEKKKFHSRIAWVIWRIRMKSGKNILINILKGKDKHFALTALTDWQIPVDFSIITDLLNSPSTRNTALKALSYHDTEESRNIAMNFITDEYESTREAAYYALGKIGTKETLYKFISHREPDNSYFKNAVKSLTDRYAGKNIEKEIRQLEKIGSSEGFLSLQPGGSFNENSRNIEAVKIGQSLNNQAGKEGMEIAALRISISLGTTAGRELEAAWKGIGSWL